MNEALRQFRHNNSDEFIFAYDKEIIDQKLASLEARLKAAEEALETIADDCETKTSGSFGMRRLAGYAKRHFAKYEGKV